MTNRLLLTIALTLLSGCSTLNSLQGNLKLSGLNNQHYEQTYYQVEITSHDGTQLRATVYQPDLPIDEFAPLIIHAHGFGAFRVSDPFSLYAKIAFTGDAALEAWRQGYWMISFDHRGFGSSGGEVSLMDPEKEVKDISSIIDWAIENIPNLKKDKQDYSIGMIGESYGGGAQLLASVMDPRIDAIIPVTTWYDFSMIAEKGATKTLWPAMLYYGGQLGSGFDINSDVATAFGYALSNELTDEVINQWRGQSLSHYCDNDRYPQADALLIQAFTDSVLPVNHALKNRDCIIKGGHDARTVLIQDGHNMPGVDGYSRFPFFSIDETVHCGPKEFALIGIALNWWNEKLKGVSGAANTIPPYCVSLDYDHGLALDTLSPVYQHFSFEQHNLLSGLAGLTELFLQPVDTMIDLLSFSGDDVDNDSTDGSAVNDQQPSGGFFRPLFIPFSTSEQLQYVLGTPKAHLSVSYEEKTPRPLLYVGLGKRKHGKSRIELINHQVVSLTGNKTHQLELPTISTRLETGDTLGLLVYGYHAHYMFRGPFLPVTAGIQGSIDVPYVNPAHPPYLVKQ